MKRLGLSVFPSLGRPGAGLIVLCMITLVSKAFAQDSTHASGWIVIPVNEYAALRARAFPVERDPELSPPVEATVTRVDYDLHIQGELASGRANLTIDVLKDGWVRVPIPGGLLVREARLDNNPVSLVPAGGRGGGQLTALLRKRGRAALVLDVALAVASTAGNERLSLPASASGVTRANVTLSRLDMDIKVTGGFLAEKAEAAAESKWLAYGNGNEPLTFTWRRKSEDHKIELPLRMRGSLTQLVGLGEDSTSIYVEGSVEVLQGAARQVRIALPASVTVNQVLGATVGDWEVRSGELTVKFLEPVEGTARFVIAGDTALPRDGAIQVPLLRVLDVERDSGGVAVEVLGAGEIKDVKSPGLEVVDAAELGQLVASRESPSLAAFRIRPAGNPAERSLTLQVARYEQQAVLTANIEEARYRILWSKEGKTLVQARYAVRNNQRNFVKIALPAGAVVWSASLAGRAVRPGSAPDGSLLLPLNKSRAGEDAPPFAIEILYLSPSTRWEEKARAAITLPALDLPISRTGVVMYYSPVYRVTAEPGSFRAEAYQKPMSAALNAEVAGTSPASTNAAPRAQQIDPLQQLDSNATQAAKQELVDRFRAKDDARRTAANLPSRANFPAVGPSLFLVSELTGENQAPSFALSYQRESKRGVK